MSSLPITIRVANVGKQFARVHEKPMRLRNAVLLFSNQKETVDELWAVRHVSFDLRAGETLGIIGRNGSGKSTLLSLVAGTTFPSEGTVSTRGRISTLLSLGAGFHLDMTGEENIITSAGLHGISVAEARRRLPDIVQFAELEEVIDTQIRYYSSGMTARLGFAITIHVSPDILVVDEVFAVGDIAFQNKCITQVRRLQQSGVTVIFASQAPSFLVDFCTRAIWLDEGRIKMIGAPRDVGNAYQLVMTGQTLEEAMQAAQPRLE